MDEPTNSSIVECDLREFFFTLIQKAAAHQKVSVSPPVITYVTEVLVSFHETAKLFAQAGVRVPVMADMLSDAMEADFYRRVTLLRQMGDTSLMVSGFFPEALSRRAVDLGYYRRMGEVAYSHLGSLTHDESVFPVLSEQFHRVSDLVSEVAENTSSRSIDMLKLIELYSKTGSDRALEKLKAQGVIPFKRKREF